MARDIARERREIDEAVRGQTVCGLFQRATEQFGGATALAWKDGDRWRELDWAAYGERARAFAKGLVALGLERGEFVNIIGSNLPEYAISDMGVLNAGGVPVSLYNTLAPEQISYIVNHSEARYVICENRSYYERFLKVRDEIGGVRAFVLWRDAEEFSKDESVLSFDDVLDRGRGLDDATYESRWRSVAPDDLVTLIYTSGTTGPPKGVMITHANVCWTLESFLRIMPIPERPRQISYLPMAHIAERMVGHYGPLRLGSSVYFCPDPRQIAAYLREVKPVWFFAVPRIWEKLHQGIRGAIAASPDDLRRAAEEGLEARLRALRLELRGEQPAPKIAAEAEKALEVTRRIAALAGLDEVAVAGTGAAPIAPEIIEFFWALGIPLYEVYGQSEDTGPTSWNRPGAVRVGTVGQSIPGVEVRLAEDGELLVRGGNVTPGYYKDPELTRETFDEDGWLHSGDVAEIDDEGFIKIVDRKKEILITAGGKNIAPSNVESMLKQHPLIGQAALVADRRPYTTALIALDAEEAAAWASKRGKPTDLATLSRDPDLRAEIQTFVDGMNTKLHSQEQVKRFTILPSEWTVDSGEVTPTLKMKRKVVYERYEREIEEMYR